MNPVPLRAFSRSPVPARRDGRSRIIAALLTTGLYGGLALLAWWAPHQRHVSAETNEIAAILLPDAPKKREPLSPFVAHLVKPRAENPAPPVISIVEAPPLLSANTAQTSPLAGGASGGGTGSGAPAGCLDAAWMRAVTGRVRQFFYYPPAALAVRKTGVAMVYFEVGRNGELGKLRISTSSGDDELDHAAIQIMQRAAPLPPIPERMHTDRVEGEMPINFGVRNFSGGSTLATCGG